MCALSSLLNSHFWFSAIGFILSGFYGVRGIFYTLRDMRMREIQIGLFKLNYSRLEKFLHCGQDFTYNFFCSVAGFVAVHIEIQIYEVIHADFGKIDAGTAVIFSFLAVFGVIGVSGALPRIFYRGGFFGPKS